jgi:hypothetical protein
MSATLDLPTLAPDPTSWASRLRLNATSDARAARGALNLSTTQSIVMSGHQATVWHPGILAKLFAADALAARLNAQVAWLVVDQDRASTISIRYPRLHADGRLAVGEFAWPGESPRADAHPLVAANLRAMLDALERTGDERSIARRVARATMDLASPYLRAQPALIFASDLAAAPPFVALVERMKRDPEACIEAYNAAVRAHPDAGVRPLTANAVQDRFELPLWHLPASQPGVRHHVYAEDLDGIPASELAPKALLMTALVRLHACDLFIHGTGGAGDESHEGYDRVMEDWLAKWLGAEGMRNLAPAVLATATRTLPLSDDPIPSAGDLAGAVWRAHHARHVPLTLGDRETELRRRELVRLIAATPRRPRAQRLSLYRSLQRLLEEYRQRHASDLDRLRHTAESLKARLDEAPILADRTWPFPLYPDAVLRELRAQIESCFAS